jgi:mannose-1-phosphate guanylyltransferase
MTAPPKAVILAGGLGTRLQPYTFFLPKPMLPLADKPLLEHLISWIRKNDVGEIVIAVSYLRNMIESYFGNGSNWGVKISYVRSDRPLGIGGQILSAKSLVDSTFFLFYGDSVFDFRLSELLKFHKDSESSLTLGLMQYSEKLRYGLIEHDEKTGRVSGWMEKPEVGGWINVGCYVSEPKLFAYIKRNKEKGFDGVVRSMVEAGERVFAFRVKGKEFIDIGDKRSYRRAYDLYLKKLGKIL